MISELDLRSLWTELDAYEREIGKETTTLSEVWVKMAQLKEKHEAEMKEYVASHCVCCFSYGTYLAITRSSFCKVH